MREDSGGVEAPVVDHIVGLTFTYYGEPATPSLAAGDGLVELSGEMLSDGPWCEAGGPSPFDADLFRVRAVRVAIRAEAASAAFRGSNPWLFRRPGTARGGVVYIPDQSVTFDVASRNLALAR